MSDVSETRGILASSAVMATGTIVSRMSGYVRNLLLAAAIGNELHADLFNIGNTIPNMLYILLAGGVFNAVLVPQLVRAQKGDPDGGEAYTNRVITLAAALPRRGDDPAGDRRAAGDAALPERLLRRPRPGRPARLRDRVRPLLPAPGLLLRDVRAARSGPQRPRPVRPDDVGADRQQRDLDRRPGALPGVVRPARRRRRLHGVHLDPGAGARSSARRWASSSRSWSCCPYLRAAGVRFRPRYDFRHSGLGHTLRLGIWTVLFVVVNQVAYTVVVRLASGGTAPSGCGAPATGAATPPATPCTPRPSCS